MTVARVVLDVNPSPASRARPVPEAGLPQPGSDPARRRKGLKLSRRLNTFLVTHDPPRHVRRALRGFIDCGVLAKGFVRVRCPDCREENLVAFSCKDRSFCPSCTARRAADTAAHLVDEVLPHVPMRQWVLALPPDLHLRVARDPALDGKLLRLFSEELEELLRATTNAGGSGRGGNVTFLQHFGSALNLHLHFHTLALDGVYVPGETADAAPVFVPAPEPTPEQVRWLCDRVARRAARLVARRPWKALSARRWKTARAVAVRLFHWTLGAAVLAAFLTAEENEWLPRHTRIGLAVLGLVVFRVGWRLWGTPDLDLHHRLLCSDPWSGRRRTRGDMTGR